MNSAALYFLLAALHFFVLRMKLIFRSSPTDDLVD